MFLDSYVIIAELKGKLKSAKGRNIIIAFLGRIINAFLGFGSAKFLASSLGPSMFGILGTISSIKGFIITAADVGFSTSTSRLGAEFLSTDQELAKFFFGWIFKLRVKIALLLLILGLILSPILAVIMLGDRSYWYLVLIPLVGVVPLTYISSTPQAILRAQNKFLALTIWQVISPLLVLICVIIYFYLNELTIVNALIIQVIASVISLPFLFYLTPILKNFYSAKKEKIFEKWADIKRVGITQAIIGLLGALDLPLSYILLYRLTSANEVGIYYGATIAAMPLLFFTQSLTSVLIPSASVLTGNHIAIKKYIKSVIKLIPIGLLFTLLLSISLPLIVKLVLGAHFKGSLSVAWILMLAYAPGTVLNAIVVSLYPLKMEKQFMWIIIITFIIHNVLRLILVPIWGAIGIAISLAVIKIISWPILIGFVFLGIKRLKFSSITIK